MNFRALLLAMMMAFSAPAIAVGMSPLSKDGITHAHAKAFYLKVINPYRDARDFRVYAIDEDGNEKTANVEIVPNRLLLGGNRSRKLIVLIKGLRPGEKRTVRVCAELNQQEGVINARVCSKLSASRPDLTM